LFADVTRAAVLRDLVVELHEDLHHNTNLNDDFVIDVEIGLF
jgi:hypothetical protein